jgi:uncharacterized membrane protein
MRLQLIFLSCFLVLTNITIAESRSYEIPEIKVIVSINSNGTVHITEHLTYVFDGTFSWAEYELPKRGFSSIENIQISENEKRYINENSERAGTFSVAKSNKNIKLKWYYNAENEQRTFTVSYTLRNALTIGPNWSQFFWNFVSETREKSTQELNITISLPQPITADSLHGWTRGPRRKVELRKSAGNFAINGIDINNDEFAKVRSVFPTYVLNQSQVAITDPAFTLARAKQEEKTYADKITKERKQQAYLSNLWGQLNYVITTLSIAIFYFLYRRYGKRHPTTRFSSTETTMIPGQIRPAAIGWLLQGRNITSNLLMATILDLARRGYFKIQEHPPEEGFLADNKPTFSIQRTEKNISDELLNWEASVIHFIEQKIQLDNQKLHKVFEGNSSDVSSWFNEWKSTVKEYCFEKNWIDENSYTGLYWNIGLQLVLLFASIPAIFFAGPAALISLFVSLMALGASFVIIRRTPKGEEVYHRWENYKEGLENAQEHNTPSNNLDKHFIYALAMGLDEKEIENLITANTDTIPVFPWILLNTNTSSLGDIASSFSTLGATGTASFPGTAGGVGASASTAGGGASASAG